VLSIQTVPYTAQPARIADPRAEIESFILSNSPYCITKSTWGDQMLDVQSVCTGSNVIHSLARFDLVESIRIEQFGRGYRVVLHHSGGLFDVAFNSRTLEGAQRAADAFQALCQPEAKREAGVTL
jgi:hypothetical protein